MTRLLICALSVALLGTLVKPDFSGKWTGQGRGLNPVGVIGPAEMTITQDAEAIRIERPYGRNRATLAIKLDGSESLNPVDPGLSPSGAAGVKRELRSKATWEGNKLKIVTLVAVTHATGEKYDTVTIETLSLEGGDLVVNRVDEAVGLDPNRSMPPGGAVKAGKQIYKRVPK